MYEHFIFSAIWKIFFLEISIRINVTVFRFNPCLFPVFVCDNSSDFVFAFYLLFPDVVSAFFYSEFRQALCYILRVCLMPFKFFIK